MQQERFEEFAALIGGIHGNIQKIKARYTQRLGLKAVHIFWLYLLRVHPEGLSASELAAASKSNRSLVSREIDELLSRGIIDTREKGSRRRYGWRFVLTERGAELAGEISQVARQVQDSVDRGIAQEDLQAFYRTLRLLAQRFDQLVENNEITGEEIDEP